MTPRRVVFRALLLSILLVAVWGAGVQAQSRRDILWGIVSNCLGPDAAQHAQECRAPRKPPVAAQHFESLDQAQAYCRSGSDVWAEVPGHFVAFRDIKMCSCPLNTGFFHGLALPVDKVSGVEAANRPEGIFQFAWQVGLAHIGADAKTNLGLAVNPRGGRSQDQLHVHIVRLRSDVAQRLAEAVPQVLRTVHLNDLRQVWQEAPPPDVDGRFSDFGVLITSDGGDGYVLRIIAPAISPEDAFTQWSCPP